MTSCPEQDIQSRNNDNLDEMDFNWRRESKHCFYQNRVIQPLLTGKLSTAIVTSRYCAAYHRHSSYRAQVKPVSTINSLISAIQFSLRFFTTK